MDIRSLFITSIVFALIFCFIKTAHAYTGRDSRSHIIPVQNKIESQDDYPVVTRMEIRVFRQSFQGEDIYKRLDRLEGKILGRTSQKSLSDRVDDLSAIVTGSDNNSSADDDSSSGDFEAPPPSYSSSDSYSDKSDDSEIYTPRSNRTSLNDLLNKLEKQLLNQVYPNDSTETRVARLEKNIFNEPADDYPMNERIERIAAVVKAEPKDEILGDLSQIDNDPMLKQGVSLATLILMIVAGLVF